MKNLLLCCLLLLFGFNALAQEPTVTVDAANKSELIFIVPAGEPQDVLFARAKEWVYRTYNSGKTVVQMEEKATGHMLLRAQTASVIRPQGGKDDGSFSYDLTIDVKDNKARFAVNNIYYKAGIGGNAMLVESGGNLADGYPANWPSVRKKSFAGAWLNIQETTKGGLVALAKSFQVALTTKAKDF